LGGTRRVELGRKAMLARMLGMVDYAAIHRTKLASKSWWVGFAAESTAQSGQCGRRSCGREKDARRNYDCASATRETQPKASGT